MGEKRPEPLPALQGGVAVGKPVSQFLLNRIEGIVGENHPRFGQQTGKGGVELPELPAAEMGKVKEIADLAALGGIGRIELLPKDTVRRVDIDVSRCFGSGVRPGCLGGTEGLIAPGGMVEEIETASRVEEDEGEIHFRMLAAEEGVAVGSQGTGACVLLQESKIFLVGRSVKWSGRTSE